MCFLWKVYVVVLVAFVTVLIALASHPYIQAVYCLPPQSLIEQENVPSNFKIYPVNDEAQSNEFKAHLKTKRLLVAGTLRNAEKSFDYIRRKFEMFTDMFGHVKFVVLENDSSDRTREMLEELGTQYDVHLPVYEISHLLPKSQLGHHKDRILRMVMIRNHLLGVVRQFQKDYDYVLMIDLDIKGTLYRDGVYDTMWNLENQPHIQAIGCHGILRGDNIYFDLYAAEFYRGPNREVCRDIKGFRKMMHFLKEILFTRNTPLEKVASTFSTGVFYRSPLPVDAWYTTYPTQYKPNECVCEHLTFNRFFDELYINHRMIQFMTEHN